MTEAKSIPMSSPAIRWAKTALEVLEAKLGTLLANLRADEMNRRNRERPNDGTHWLTPGEYLVASALAALIVPSDETGPGAQEARGADTLDRLVAGSHPRQLLYAYGLLAFDELAQHKHDRGFAELDQEKQMDLLTRVERVRAESATRSSLEKITRRAAILCGRWGGLPAAVDLFPTLVEDVLQAFYTSRVAWEWLGYDGPPMPTGYYERVQEQLILRAWPRGLNRSETATQKE